MHSLVWFLIVFRCHGVNGNMLIEAVPRWVRSAGYPLEVHTVDSNGYLLTVHRLPQPGPATSAMIVHGLGSSSTDWVIHGPKKALGYLLHDVGVDVWLPNVRGTPASLHHKSLNSNQQQFWNFTFEDQGTEDVLSITDYILKLTKNEKIHYISNSMGGAAFLSGLSLKPKYNSKYHQGILMCPHSNMNNTYGIVRELSSFAKPIQRLATSLQIPKFPFGNNDEILAFSFDLCSRQAEIQSNICVALHNLFLGNGAPLNVPLFLKGSRYYPTSTSIKTLLHIFQTIGTNKFARYDYGKSGNINHYGSPTPPPYNLKKVTIPIFIFYAKDDNLVTPKDIEWLKKQLPNVVNTYYISRDFSHGSFLWHPNVTDMVYKKIVKLVTDFTEKSNKVKKI